MYNVHYVLFTVSWHCASYNIRMIFTVRRVTVHYLLYGHSTAYESCVSNSEISVIIMYDKCATITRSGQTNATDNRGEWTNGYYLLLRNTRVAD